MKFLSLRYDTGPMQGFPGHLNEYSYAYDESLVAYAPAATRSESRLLLVRRFPVGGLPRFEDCSFRDLPSIIEGDAELKKKLLVRNRSKVLPARFFAKRQTGSRHEIVLAERVNAQEWKALIRNVAKVKVPELLQIENIDERVEIVAPDRVRFFSEDVPSLMARVGRIPLPPYIKREVREEDKGRYQSVWATGEALSAAAPTASLHFTDEIWEQIQNAGMKSADAFLHVGRGTFEALRENDLSKAELHEEAFEVARDDLQKIQSAKSVFAVGTTACRLTETIARLSTKSGDFRITEEGALLKGWTKLFVKPGFAFEKVGALLTNFHLPESSLLVLVSVFAGSYTLAREAYEHAVEKKYRLFSYGDSSLWI